MSHLFGLWHVAGFVAMLMIGLYIVIARDNLVKKMMGLNIFQVAVILFYVSIGKVDGGTAPIWPEMPHHEAGASHHEDEGHALPPATYAGPHGEQIVFSNPVPHVLMLTAIVVGVATTALGLALVVRIKEAYGTAEEDEIVAIHAREEGA